MRTPMTLTGSLLLTAGLLLSSAHLSGQVVIGGDENESAKAAAAANTGAKVSGSGVSKANVSLVTSYRMVFLFR